MESSLEDRLWESMFRDGQKLLREGKRDEALKEFQGAVNLSEKFGNDDARRPQSLSGLALAYCVGQDFERAEPLFEKAVDLLAHGPGADEDMELAVVLKHLAYIYDHRRKFKKAEEAYARAIGIYERTAPTSSELKSLREKLDKVKRQAKKEQEDDDDLLVVIKPAKKKTYDLEDETDAASAAAPEPRSKESSQTHATVKDSTHTHATGKSAARQQPAEVQQTARGKSVSPHNLIGNVLDNRYEVTERIAAGGMSVIYKARHTHLGRMVAIKVMHPHLMQHERNMQRFLQEARMASGLTHQHIVTVRDFGMDPNGLCYIVMDFVEGETLANRVNRKHHLPASEFVPILKQIADALAYAHEHELLHRDLKPSNIMLENGANGKDVAKIVDFGIAKVVSKSEDALSLTQTGETVGSPLYMSPEQCRGRVLDARSDIYSLGCLSYKALTGAPPFIGANDVDVYFRHISDEPPPMKQTNPDVDVPPELERIVMQSLRKNPDDRQQSMLELRQQLDQLQI
jgi:tRNA A-37 threonylcarbamoyl transferase component Bud32